MSALDSKLQVLLAQLQRWSFRLLAVSPCSASLALSALPTAAAVEAHQSPYTLQRHALETGGEASLALLL